ncbi:hypothetical protein [Allorhodopirellula heiligendammensis]|uniref:Uncharacterized protein n=1 Tax=Allorhodopirellula heiligendammensis TaxID=2714739 RepID=A0A5C6C562_9BACT|nr:hypothetical protein [Allorhodopirellula heiligendammensis]TWU19760.1 hypothetical protein Poly21_19380 [Allorhodopirellula heiligendammensis]
MFHFQDDVYVSIAYSLIHFLWLASIPAAMLAIALRLISPSASELRYRLRVAAMAAMLFMVVVAVCWAIAPRSQAWPRQLPGESTASQTTVDTIHAGTSVSALVDDTRQRDT